jgi:hypothetical protein
MRTTAEYLQHAIACRELAERTTRRRDKKTLEELAKAWEKIAAFREQDLKITAFREQDLKITAFRKQDLKEAKNRADIR